MDVRREHMGRARHKRRNSVTLDEFYQFFFHYFLDILIAKDRFKKNRDEPLAVLHSLKRTTRFEEISAACAWTAADVQKMHDDFNRRAMELFKIGVIVTIDETLLAYFGIDAKVQELLRLIPGKPHDFGLLGYRAVALLSHSRARAILVILPQLPSAKWTPTGAALRIMNLVREQQAGSAHFVMDSAFATTELLDELRRLAAAVSLSLKSNRTAGFGALYDLATHGLAAGEVRTYSVDHYILQARRKQSESAKGGEDLHVVLSSGWRTDIPHDLPIKRLLNYDTVVYLYLNEPASELSEAFKCPTYTSKRDLLLRATNWDVLAPPPNRAGRIEWTEENLKKMRVQLLRDLHAETPHCSGSSRKNAGTLVQEIVAHHPHVEPLGPSAVAGHAKPKDIIGLRQWVGVEPSHSAAVLDLYSHEYGAVDKVNQEIYRSILLSGHHSYEKLLGFSVLHAMCMNAWAACLEARALRLGHNPQGRRVAPGQAKQQSFAKFMLAACKQFVERGMKI